MAFPFDSLSAFLLLAAAIFSWGMSGRLRSGARLNLRFAAVMLAAFAVSSWTPIPELVFAVGWVAVSLAATALSLVFVFPKGAPVWLASFAFSGAFVLGLAGALAQPLAGLTVEGAAASVLLAIGFARFPEAPRASVFGAAGAFALLCAGFSLMDGAAGRAALFLAALLFLLKNAVIELEPARDLLIGANRA